MTRTLDTVRKYKHQSTQDALGNLWQELKVDNTFGSASRMRTVDSMYFHSNYYQVVVSPFQKYLFIQTIDNLANKSPWHKSQPWVGGEKKRYIEIK